MTQWAEFERNIKCRDFCKKLIYLIFTHNLSLHLRIAHLFACRASHADAYAKTVQKLIMVASACAHCFSLCALLIPRSPPGTTTKTKGTWSSSPRSPNYSRYLKYLMTDQPRATAQFTLDEVRLAIHLLSMARSILSSSSTTKRQPH